MSKGDLNDVEIDPNPECDRNDPMCIVNILIWLCK